jgi:hypothetical protein
VQQYVTQLEKQLPSKAEMDALLSDINQAGLGRSLSFELFRPGQVSVKEYYAELPIAVLKVTGRTTTSARSPPTSPTCHASSRSTTWRSRPEAMTACCRWTRPPRRSATSTPRK